MNARQKSLPLIAAVIAASSLAPAADFDLAAQATNKIAVDLYRQLATGDENLCLLPYSIQSALAMTFAGADGEIRNEMARVLYFQGENDAIHASFDALRHSLTEMTKKTETIGKESKKSGGPNEPITLAIANRLFAQDGYAFRDAFRALVRKFYGAPFEPLDFRKDPDGAARHINHWVAEQKRDRIRDLIPPRWRDQKIQACVGERDLSQSAMAIRIS